MRLPVAILVLAMTTRALASPPPPPPQCLGPDTWDGIQKCLRADEPSLSVVVNLSPHTRGATDATHRYGRLYVQELDGRWRNQRAFAATVEVAADTTTTTPTTSRGPLVVRRIEFREVVDYGNRTQLRLKSAVVCGVGANPACQLRAYECTALANGRSVAVVKGELRVEPGSGDLELVVDRSRAGELCNSL